MQSSMYTHVVICTHTHVYPYIHAQAEAAAQRSAMLDMYKASALGALRKAGVVLTDMQVAPVGRLYDSAVWRLTPMKKQRGKVTLPYHKYGSSVTCPVWSGKKKTRKKKRKC